MSESAHWRDYLALTKPGVVMLLMVTAVAGMFLACLLYTSPSPRDRG